MLPALHSRHDVYLGCSDQAISLLSSLPQLVSKMLLRCREHLIKYIPSNRMKTRHYCFEYETTAQKPKLVLSDQRERRLEMQELCSSCDPTH